MKGIFIGIDDTDNADSRGTGFLARALAEECRRRDLHPRGVTRHQLLVDPRIPYTSHNSSACVALDDDAGVGSIEWAFDFVARRSAPGSDPGVCVARADDVTGPLGDFGRRAVAEVVGMDEALRLAPKGSGGIDLRALGGSGLGVIGALAAVGLRAGGNDGRFIDLPGLRDLSERVGVEDLARLGIRLEHRGGRAPAPDDVYETLGWVRPNLIGGEPVLPLLWSVERNAWLPVERKHSHAVE